MQGPRNRKKVEYENIVHTTIIIFELTVTSVEFRKFFNLSILFKALLRPAVAIFSLLAALLAFWTLILATLLLLLLSLLLLLLLLLLILLAAFMTPLTTAIAKLRNPKADMEG